MEITVNTVKKYDYKLTISPVKDNQANNITDTARGMNFSVYGRYIKENGEAIYNTTFKCFKNKAAAIRFYMKKMDLVKA